MIPELNKVKPWIWVLLLCSLQTMIHIPALRKPAMGTHIWRQCNSLALARNYHEEDMRIWLPRIDKRYNFPGTTGPSFTAYEYGLALGYRVFGFSQTLHRIYSLLWSFAAIAGIFVLSRSWLKSNLMAGATGMSLIAIPEFYYHSVNAIPDLAALALMLWGWVCGRKWLRTGSTGFAVLCSLWLALAGMVKLQFLIAGIPLAVESWSRGYWTNRKFWFKAVCMVMVVLGASAAWYAWARYLTFQYWLLEFVHEVRLPSSILDFFARMASNLFADLPETWLGYMLLPGFIYGMILLLRHVRGRQYAIHTAIGAAVIYILLQRQFEHHGYYSLFLAPFFAMVSGFGLVKAAGKWNRAILLFAILAPSWAVLRMSRNWDGQNARVPLNLHRAEVQDRVLSISDTSRRYIVGPDPSGCVYFYFLHAKGFPWYREDDKAADMTRWVRWGADGMITDKPELAQRLYSDSLIFTVEAEEAGFTWFGVKLRRP